MVMERKERDRELSFCGCDVWEAAKTGCSCASRKRVDRRAREETNGGDGKEGTALCFMCECSELRTGGFFLFFSIGLLWKRKVWPCGLALSALTVFLYAGTDQPDRSQRKETRSWFHPLMPSPVSLCDASKGNKGRRSYFTTDQ